MELFLFVDTERRMIRKSKDKASGVDNFSSPFGTFQYLLTSLGDTILQGRTTNVYPFRDYIGCSDEVKSDKAYCDFE